jgi:hypothetical protein
MNLPAASPPGAWTATRTRPCAVPGIAVAAADVARTQPRPGPMSETRALLISDSPRGPATARTPESRPWPEADASRPRRTQGAGRCPA